MIGKTISHYKILEKLGEGGMGEVYLAEDTKLRRKVALKFLPDQYASDPDITARFTREARTAAGLSHPNIITIHEVGQHGDRPYIAMAYVEGQTLSDLIASEDFTVEQAVDIGVQLCEGLDSAHKAGIVHRDIKPDNILVDREGRAKILDFGLAKLRGVSRLTAEQSTLGTLYYMSPEQVRGEEVDSRSDIFSLGAVLYEMFARQQPFKGDHSAAVIYSITNEDPRPPSRHNGRIPPALDRIVSVALAKNPDQRYKTAADVATDLRKFTSSLTPAGAASPSNWLKYLLPTSVVFLAVILLIIFKPFRFEISPDQDAIAAQNSLAVMYFENYGDREDTGRVGEIVTNLLITDLSESEYLKVVSSQRLYDILKLQGKEGVKVIDRTTATEVAGEAGAKWMLLGSILQETPAYVVTSQLVEVESGNVIASQRVTGQEGEKIFSIVDRLTDEIRGDLTLPAGADQEKGIPIAEATTHSTEAYRYYLEGMDNLNKFYMEEAKASFDKALEHDSTFAMVYLRQANAGIAGGRAERKKAIAKAMQYADKVSKKERHYILSSNALISGDVEGAVAELEDLVAEYPDEKEAYKALGDICRNTIRDPEKAVAYYRKAVEIDPLDKFSYNLLAYQYQSMGDIDNYIWAIYQYMSLAPDEANPYDSRADLYAFSGKIDKAIKSYETALERKPDFYPSIAKLGHMYLFKKDYDRAQSYYEQLIASEDDGWRKTGKELLMLIPAYRGQFKTALAMLDESIREDEEKGETSDDYADKLMTRADIFAMMGQPAAGFEDFEKGYSIYQKNNPDDLVSWRGVYIRLLARNGEYEKAEDELVEFKAAIEATDRSRMNHYWLAKGLVDMEKGNVNEATVSFEKAAENIDWFFFRYFLALSYLNAGRLPESINEFEKLLRRYSEDRAWNPVWAVLSYYHLGVAYENSGRPDKAIKKYVEFLDTWKAADPGIEEVKDARERLARLQVAG